MFNEFLHVLSAMQMQSSVQERPFRPNKHTFISLLHKRQCDYFFLIEIGWTDQTSTVTKVVVDGTEVGMSGTHQTSIVTAIVVDGTGIIVGGTDQTSYVTVVVVDGTEVVVGGTDKLYC